jgi:hypothetical protein
MLIRFLGYLGSATWQVAFLYFDLSQNAGGRRGISASTLSVDLKQRLVALDFIANFLQPLGNGAFKNRFAHLRHHHVHACTANGY